MNTRVALIPIGPGDQQFLLSVYGSTRADEMALVNWSDEQKQEFVKMQFEAQHRHYHAYWPGAQYSIVQYDSQRAGRIYIDRRENEIHVIDIAILPEFRGKGIGEFLMRQVILEAHASMKPVTIYVERFNRAQTLYKRLGFVPVQDQGVYLLWRCDPQVVAATV